jgi:transcription antitermination factor NusG
MADLIFSVGEDVRITGGAFVGLEGVVIPPSDPTGSLGTAVLAGSNLTPVAVATMIDGHAITLRIPPELLERIA